MNESELRKIAEAGREAARRFRISCLAVREAVGRFGSDTREAAEAMRRLEAEVETLALLAAIEENRRRIQATKWGIIGGAIVVIAGVLLYIFLYIPGVIR